MGISFKMASELSINCMNARLNNTVSVDFTEYPELRRAGYSHIELANKEFNPTILEDIKDQKYNINELISNRLAQILKNTD